jgi:hypothetical protein
MEQIRPPGKVARPTTSKSESKAHDGLEHIGSILGRVLAQLVERMEQGEEVAA